MNARSGPRRFATTVAASLAATGLVAASLAVAQAPAPSPEQAIKYRQSVYRVILWNFGPMAAVAQGRAEYDATTFAYQAERVATMAPMLLEGYPHGSHTGATTRAKVELWQNMEEFRQLMKAMEGKATALAEVAKEGDKARSLAAFGELGAACKACHDKYRSD